MNIATELHNCVFNQLCGGLLALKDALNLNKYKSFVVLYILYRIIKGGNI